MVEKILKFFSRKSTESSNAFSHFFNEASSKERVRVLKETARAANEEQQELVNKYEEEVFDNSKKTYN